MSGHSAVEFLTAALARVEETAKAATPGPWIVERDEYHGVAVRDVDPEIPGVPGRTTVAFEPYRDEAASSNFEHIALHGPASVLRRITFDRALLADLQAERHLVVDGDCWYTCPAATEERDGGENCDDDRRGGPCDCGREARVERRIRLLAEGYGWEAS